MCLSFTLKFWTWPPARNGWIETDMGSSQRRWLQLGQCPVDKRKIGQFVADEPRTLICFAIKMRHDCKCMKLLCVLSLNHAHAVFIKEMMFLLDCKSGNLCFLNCWDLTLGQKPLRIRLFIFSGCLAVLKNKKTLTNNDGQIVSVPQFSVAVKILKCNVRLPNMHTQQERQELQMD